MKFHHLIKSNLLIEHLGNNSANQSALHSVIRVKLQVNVNYNLHAKPKKYI